MYNTYGGCGQGLGDPHVVYSILCQAAIAVPFLLWGSYEAYSSRRRIEVGGNTSSVAGCGFGGFYGASGAKYRAPQQLVYIANDWPTGLLPLWLRHFMGLGEGRGDVCLGSSRLGQ